MQQALIFQSTSRLLEAISYTLQQITASTQKNKCIKTVFNSNGSVSATLPDYLLRLFRYMNCSNSCFIIALILLDRLQLMNPVYVLNHRNVHKLVVTAIIISIKSYDDQFHKQSYYAKVAGLNLEDLNALESTFLTNIQFSTFVTSETFNTYAQKLEEVLGDSKRKMNREKSSEDLSTVGSRCSRDDISTKQRGELQNSFSSNKN